MSAPVILFLAKFDFGGSWVTVSGSNPFTATAGKGLICFQNAYIGASTAQIALPTDSAGTWTDFTGTGNFGDSAMQQRVGYQLNPTAGSHTLTLPSRDPANDDQFILVIEDDTLPTSGLVQVAPNKKFDALSATTWSITTGGTNPGSGDRVYASTLIENSAPTSPENMTNPTGWNQIWVSQDGTNNLPSQMCYLDPGSTAALTPSWSCTNDTHITNHLSVTWGFTKTASPPPPSGAGLVGPSSLVGLFPLVGPTPLITPGGLL